MEFTSENVRKAKALLDENDGGLDRTLVVPDNFPLTNEEIRATFIFKRLGYKSIIRTTSIPVA